MSLDKDIKAIRFLFGAVVAASHPSKPSKRRQVSPECASLGL